MDAKQLIDQFFTHLTEASETVSQLSNRVADVIALQEAREAAQDEIDQLESRIGSLLLERRELLRNFGQMQFEEDMGGIARTTKRRNIIDADITKAERAIEKLRKTIANNQPDLADVAAIAVSLDLVSLPDPYTFTQELNRALIKDVYSVDDMQQELRNSLPDVDQTLYEKQRKALDSTYMPYTHTKTTAPRKTYREANDTSSFVEANNLVSTGTAVNDRVSVDVSDKSWLDE